MKFYYALLLIGFYLISCGTSKKGFGQANMPDKIDDKKSEISKIADTKSRVQHPDILVGIKDKNALLQAPYDTWFTTNYENYKPEPEVIDSLSSLLSGVTIKAFMGTWCGDSKRETPTLYKILEAANYNLDNLQLITLTRNKDTPQGLENGLQIERVPTFIFYKNNKEIGRYVEFARESLEKDMLAILSGEEYKHSYED